MQRKKMFTIWSQNDEILIEEFNNTSSNRNNKGDITKLCNIIKNMSHFKFNGKDQSMHSSTQNRNIQLSYQNNLLIFLEKVFNLIKKALSDTSNSKIKKQLNSSILVSFDIDPNNILRLIFYNDGNNSKKNQCERAIQIISEIINQYKHIIEYEIKADDFKILSSSFFKDVDDIINMDLSESDYSILDELSSKVCQLSQKIINQMYLYNTEIDKYLLYFLHISKYHKKYQNCTIYNILLLISELYESNIGTAPIIQSLQDFINLVNKKNYQFDSFDQSMKKELDQIFSEIDEQKKYYYFDYLFQILIKNILDQKFFIDQNSIDFEIKDEIQFSFDNSFSYIFNNYFYLRKNYLNVDYETEKRIFSCDKYKNIVHLNKQNQMPENMIDIPYFPNGNVHNLIENLNSKQGIKINNVDKLVMILEIANALNDLHENNEFHGNLCDADIYISSNLNAYIGFFCYSSCGLFNMSNDYESFDSTFKRNKLNDIYSFGLILYEMVTETIVTTLNNDATKTKDLVPKLNEYKYFDEKFVDLGGNSMHEFKEIIVKCIKTNPSERYQSMIDIINEIKMLKIYKNNKEEINLRLDTCVHGKDYKCSISDIFESYFRGNKNCDAVINEFLKGYNKNVFGNKYLPIDYYNDKIRNIFEVFHVTNNQQQIENRFSLDSFNNDECLMILLNKAKYHFYQTNLDFNNNLKSILQYHYLNFDDCYQEFVKKYEMDKKPLSIEEIQMNGDYFYIDRLYQIVINDLSSLSLLAFKFHDMLKNKFEIDDCELFDIRNTIQSDNHSYQTKLCCDNHMNFYLQKTFNDDFDQNSLKREKDILSNYKEYRFVTRIDYYFQNNDNNNNIIIPYYPLGDLNNLINNIEFSSIDKIVIILEIATALNDLHSDDNYHGNLSDHSILFNSNCDAYISNFYFKENAIDCSNHIYYRMPEYFNNKDDQTFIENQARDIYSFGVLMYEIVTDISPEKLFKCSNRLTVFNVLKENYKEFLFSFFDKAVDFDGNNLTGLKEIISKCIDQERGKRFSSMDNIIKCIKKLPIYIDNKSEIDNRMKKPNSIFTECTIKDLIISYYRGHKNSLIDIENFIHFCTNNSMLHDHKISGDLFEKIHNSLGLNLTINNSADSNLFELVSKATNHIPTTIDEISNLFDKMVKIYGKYIAETSLYSAFQDFVNDFNKVSQNKNDSSIKEEFIQAFIEAQNQDKYFYIFSFVHLLFNKIFDSKFVEKFKSAYANSNRSFNSFFDIKDELLFNEPNSCYSLQCDSDFNFYLQKTYISRISPKKIKREMNILSKKYSKYIVFYDDSKYKMHIPYYPNGTLENIIMKQNCNYHGRTNKCYKLSEADKLTNILEIASALNALHENNEYHGNLSDRFIFIDSKRDAYIGSFCYDTNVVDDIEPFYYRSPEKNEKKYMYLYQINDYDDDDDDLTLYSDEDKKNYIKGQILNDIFAFGVLMHEIVTETNPKARFNSQRYCRDARIKTVSNNYKDFLFSGENNEFFGKEDYKGMKKIIEKCLSQNPEERFPNMKEIINSIKKLPIYESNKDEIEYRLDHSTDSSEYKCKISDIVESYYQGQGNCFYDIEYILTKYQALYFLDALLFFNIEGDLMQNIFTVFNESSP